MKCKTRPNFKEVKIRRHLHVRINKIGYHFHFTDEEPEAKEKKGRANTRVYYTAGHPCGQLEFIPAGTLWGIMQNELQEIVHLRNGKVETFTY